jgi:hypothetical protein
MTLQLDTNISEQHTASVFGPEQDKISIVYLEDGDSTFLRASVSSRGVSTQKTNIDMFPP